MPLISSDPDFNHNPAVQSAGSLTGTGSLGGQNQNAQSGGTSSGAGAGVSGGGGIQSSSSAGANRADQSGEQQAARDAADNREHGGGDGGGPGAGLSSGGLAQSLGGISRSSAGIGNGGRAEQHDAPSGGIGFGGRAEQQDNRTGPRGIVDPMGNQHPVSSLDTLGIRDVNFVDPRMNAFRDFIEHGKTPAMAEGMVGSLFGESAFNPLAGDYATGTHLGYGQWGGSRLTNLESFSGTPFTGPRGPGVDALSGPTPKAQTDFIREEMMGTRYPDVGKRKSAQSLQAAMEANPDMTREEAARAFTSMYERPSKKEIASSIGGRIREADRLHSDLAGLGEAPGYGSSSAAAFVNPMSSNGRPAAIPSPVNPTGYSGVQPGISYPGMSPEAIALKSADNPAP